MVILGIDPGLTRTGYGLLSVDNEILNVLDYGVIEPNKNDIVPKRLYTIYSDIEQLIQTFSYIISYIK